MELSLSECQLLTWMLCTNVIIQYYIKFFDGVATYSEHSGG